MTNGKATEFLLKTIAERLAGREDCKKVTYTVTIDHGGVSMSPLIYVFPNRYKRKESDKLDIIAWVHQYQMPNAKLSDFVFGTYQYRQDGESKKRRWTRV